MSPIEDNCPLEVEEFKLNEADMIIDAIDSIEAKTALAAYCIKNNLNLKK